MVVRVEHPINSGDANLVQMVQHVTGPSINEDTVRAANNGVHLAGVAPAVDTFRNSCPTHLGTCSLEERNATEPTLNGHIG